VADEVAKPWILLALYTGMRPTELEALKWDDIDFENREFVVRESKTGKKRQVYIHDSAWEMVKDLGASTGSALLLRTWQDRKERWKRPEKFIQKAFKAAKISDACYRDLRRTCATWLFDAGVEWAVIKLVLGHQMRDATAIYARTTQKLIRGAIEKLPALPKITQEITQRGDDFMGTEPWTA
jgi:integrase